MSHKIFENNLVAACKSKLALKLNTPAYTAMCTLELSPNSVMITNKYDNNSKLLSTDTHSLLYEIKTRDFYEGLSSDFSNFQTKLQYYDNSKIFFEKSKMKLIALQLENLFG